MKKIIIAYVPVIHSGYLSFFSRHRDVDEIAIFGPSIINQFDHLSRKDIRAVAPEDIRHMIESLNVFRRVYVLDMYMISHIINEKPEIVMPDEDESRELASKHFGELAVVYDTSFLRWDKSRSLKEVPVTSEIITHDALHQKRIGDALMQAKKSSDWWRQVGAVLVQGDTTLYGYNKHIPSDLSPYVLGDPRGLFNKGVSIELTTAEHAEAYVIAEAARRGISLLGAQLYVTTFPCPMCARLIAHAGISECYFSGGYGVLDGEEILRRAGVTLYRVIEETPSSL